MRRSLSSLASLAIAVSLTVYAGQSTSAGEIPDGIIKEQHKACVTACESGNSSKAGPCEQFCSCMDAQIEQHFTALDYMTLTRDLQDPNGLEKMPEDLKQKYDNVFLVCH